VYTVLAITVPGEVIVLNFTDFLLWSYINHNILSAYNIFISENMGYISDWYFRSKYRIHIIDIYRRYISCQPCVALPMNQLDLG